MSRSDLAFEHEVLANLRIECRTPRRVLMAVSGGMDSVVMAELLLKWRRLLKLELAVAHVHHGHSQAKGQNRYRARAAKFAETWAQKHQLVYLTNNELPVNLKSEQEFRLYRHGLLREWQFSGGYNAVAFAHHADDLLETRLMRLIRGAGSRGLTAMTLRRGWKWRPLLQISRARIASYAHDRKLKYVHDPSNEKTTALRNWVRNEWLPRLEARQSGATKALSRSLELIAGPDFEVAIGPYVGLRRSALTSLPYVRRQAVIARYLNSLGLRDYGKTHVSEILKRIETTQTQAEFELLGHVFRFSTDLLWASRV